MLRKILDFEIFSQFNGNSPYSKNLFHPPKTRRFHDFHGGLVLDPFQLFVFLLFTPSKIATN